MPRRRRKPDARQRARVLNPNKGRRPASVVASGERVRQRGADAISRVQQPWQDRAFAYYDMVPEIKFAAQFYARGLSSLRLYAAEVDDSGEVHETDNEAVIAHVDRIQDPGGGRANLLAAYGRLMFLAGEAMLLVTADPDTGDEKWEMLSHVELSTKDDGRTYERTRAPGEAPIRYANADDAEYAPPDAKTAVAYRLWKRHPLYSYLADSTMQGVLDVAEELVLLTQAVRARARSRLASAGILLVNHRELEPPAQSDDEPQPDEDPNEDAFLTDLNEAMLAPLTNEGTASAVVPLVVRVDTDDIENVMKHLKVIDPVELYPETGLRKEAIERLAIGLDMPPEVLLGLAESNHWSAWQIDEQTWKAHLQPVADQLVSDLTASFLRPQLAEDGIEGRYVIAYNATDVVNHPDRTGDARDAYDRMELSGDSFREYLGFDEDDAPSEDERRRRVGVLLKDIGVALGGDPTGPAAGAPSGPAGQPAQPDDGGPQGSGDVEPGPPDPPANGKANGNGRAPAAPAVAARVELTERIMGASEQTVLRARELAGSRLRSLAKRDPDAEAAVRGVDAHEVPAALGRDLAARIGAPSERELVAGAASLLAAAFRLWGLDPNASAPLGQRLERHAARHLWDDGPRQLPASFRAFVAGVAGPKEPAR